MQLVEYFKVIYIFSDTNYKKLKTFNYFVYFMISYYANFSGTTKVDEIGGYQGSRKVTRQNWVKLKLVFFFLYKISHHGK